MVLPFSTREGQGSTGDYQRFNAVLLVLATTGDHPGQLVVFGASKSVPLVLGGPGGMADHAWACSHKAVALIPVLFPSYV